MRHARQLRFRDALAPGCRDAIGNLTPLGLPRQGPDQDPDGGPAHHAVPAVASVTIENLFHARSPFVLVTGMAPVASERIPDGLGVAELASWIVAAACILLGGARARDPVRLRRWCRSWPVNPTTRHAMREVGAKPGASCRRRIARRLVEMRFQSRRSQKSGSCWRHRPEVTVRRPYSKGRSIRDPGSSCPPRSVSTRGSEPSPPGSVSRRRSRAAGPIRLLRTWSQCLRVYNVGERLNVVRQRKMPHEITRCPGCLVTGWMVPASPSRAVMLILVSMRHEVRSVGPAGGRVIDTTPSATRPVEYWFGPGRRSWKTTRRPLGAMTDGNITPRQSPLAVCNAIPTCHIGGGVERSFAGTSSRATASTIPRLLRDGSHLSDCAYRRDRAAAAIPPTATSSRPVLGQVSKSTPARGFSPPTAARLAAHLFRDEKDRGLSFDDPKNPNGSLGRVGSTSHARGQTSPGPGGGMSSPPTPRP